MNTDCPHVYAYALVPKELVEANEILSFWLLPATSAAERPEINITTTTEGVIRTRRKRCRPPSSSKRPANCFFLYKQWKARDPMLITQYPNVAHRNKVIGAIWRHEPDSVKNYWRQAADQLSLEAE